MILTCIEHPPLRSRYRCLVKRLRKTCREFFIWTYLWNIYVVQNLAQLFQHQIYIEFFVWIKLELYGTSTWIFHRATVFQLSKNLYCIGYYIERKNMHVNTRGECCLLCINTCTFLAFICVKLIDRRNLSPAQMTDSYKET